MYGRVRDYVEGETGDIEEDCREEQAILGARGDDGHSHPHGATYSATASAQDLEMGHPALSGKVDDV